MEILSTLAAAMNQFGAAGLAMGAMYLWNRHLRSQIDRLRNERDDWKERCLAKHEETMDEYQKQADLMEDQANVMEGLFRQLKESQNDE
jgi:hypothetical protein